MASMRRIQVRWQAALCGVTTIAIFALAGCGESGGDPRAGGDAKVTDAVTANPSAPPNEKSVDPCALVTHEEAQQLASTPLNDAKRVLETCTYTAPVSGPTAQVEVFVGDGAKNQLDIDRQLGHEFKTLAGIGDEAYAEDDFIFFNKSGLWVSIRLVRLTDAAEHRQPLEDLARKAAGRL
jgi:hypothetical protein